MKTIRAINLLRAALLAFSLIFAPLAVRTLGQNTNTTQSGATTQSNRQTTTTTQSQPTTTSQTTTTNQPAQTSSTQTTTGIDPMWIVIGVVALLAILLIAILSMRGRSRGSDTVVERKTTVKRE